MLNTKTVSMPLDHRLFFEHSLAALNNTTKLDELSKILIFYLDRVACLPAEEKDRLLNEFLSYATQTGLVLITPVDLVEGKFTLDQDIYLYLLEETFGEQHGNAY